MNLMLLFRAWNKKEKRWANPEEVLVDGRGRTLTYDRATGQVLLSKDWEVHRRIVGKNDDENKPIYVGDIVSVVPDYPLCSGHEKAFKGIVVEEGHQVMVEFPDYGTAVGIDGFEEIKVVSNEFEAPDFFFK